jgi:hypothetical protein
MRINEDKGREHILADSEEVVRQLREELVRVVSVDAAYGATVGETSTVMEVTRVDEEKVDAAKECNLLHVLDERREVTKVTGVVGLGERRLW